MVVCLKIERFPSPICWTPSHATFLSMDHCLWETESFGRNGADCVCQCIMWIVVIE
jgi:hypothetical protein